LVLCLGVCAIVSQRVVVSRCERASVCGAGGVEHGAVRAQRSVHPDAFLPEHVCGAAAVTHRHVPGLCGGPANAAPCSPPPCQPHALHALTPCRAVCHYLPAGRGWGGVGVGLGTSLGGGVCVPQAAGRAAFVSGCAGLCFPFAPWFAAPQVFCAVLWLMDEYWQYTIFSLFSVLMLESTTTFQRLRTFSTLHGMCPKPYPLKVRRAEWEPRTASRTAAAAAAAPSFFP
jgi:hypothetical protein